MRESKIFRLFEEAELCTRCDYPLGINVPLPDRNNGFENVKIMFLNERPGRVGTGKSGRISFDNDDPSARAFKTLFGILEEEGLTRKEIFITNACICYDADSAYRDKPPKVKEMRNCHYWLKKQIDILQPLLIVTIGAKPLQSLKMFYPNSTQLQDFELKQQKHEQKWISDTLPWIYPVYHTSKRAQITRSLEQQKEDWRKIPQILRKFSTNMSSSPTLTRT